MPKKVLWVAPRSLVVDGLQVLPARRLCRACDRRMHVAHSHVNGLERHAHSSQEARRGVGPRDAGEVASLPAPAQRSECRRHTYSRFMMGAFHTGRRCGTCCDGNDTSSAMCAGSELDGAFQLRKTSLLEVEARCSRDEACAGYYAWNKPPNYTDVGDMVRPVTRWGTTGSGFRFKSGKVYGWAKLERVGCSWPDLRRRGATADAVQRNLPAPATAAMAPAIPGPEHLLAPMQRGLGAHAAACRPAAQLHEGPAAFHGAGAAGALSLWRSRPADGELAVPIRDAPHPHVRPAAGAALVLPGGRVPCAGAQGRGRLLSGLGAQQLRVDAVRVHGQLLVHAQGRRAPRAAALAAHPGRASRRDGAVELL
eukprot:scaffold35192_cov64-Phaeocystis_antarctica.AAC.8